MNQLKFNNIGVGFKKSTGKVSYTIDLNSLDISGCRVTEYNGKQKKNFNFIIQENQNKKTDKSPDFQIVQLVSNNEPEHD